MRVCDLGTQVLDRANEQMRGSETAPRKSSSFMNFAAISWLQVSQSRPDHAGGPREDRG